MQFLGLLSDYFIFLDGTERPIPRPTNYERQAYYYSGKKGAHTIKNNLITDYSQRILFLSPTVEGKMYDKTLAEEGLSFPPRGLMMQDPGYRGYAPDKLRIIMPGKKPRNGTLTLDEGDL